MSTMTETFGYYEPTDRGSWMQTYTGRQFYPLHPYPNDVDPEDIAHALAHICRYGGHVDRFYSVAEHCVLMSRAVAPEHALSALLHDATEAYIVDVPRPLKHLLLDYQDIEDEVWLAVSTRFRIPLELDPSIKIADNRMLLAERDQLLKDPPPIPWTWANDLKPAHIGDGWLGRMTNPPEKRWRLIAWDDYTR